MDRHSSDVSALVGLDGFVVRAQALDEATGEWWLAVETTEDRAWRPLCGARATGHGRRRVKVRDLPVADRPVVLVWAKRIWRCGEERCAMGSWSEESDEIAPRAVLTERARAEIARRVGPEEHSVARAARDFGVSWHAAMAAVWDHGRPRVDHLARLGAPAAIGLDETSFLSATASHSTLLVTGIVDLDTGRLVDVLPARSAQAVRSWLAAKPTRWRDGIAHVVIDPYQPYASAVAAELPQARVVVVDHFHAIRLANQALDEVRRRVQQQTLHHRGHKTDPLYRIRRRLLAGHERLGHEGFRPLPARQLRRLFERAADLDRAISGATYGLDHAQRARAELARKRAATERAISEDEARLAKARAVLEKFDKPLVRRRRLAEVEGARSLVGWLPGAIERDRGALAKLRQDMPAAERRLRLATTACKQVPDLEAERSEVQRRLDADTAARAAEPVTAAVFDRVGPRPRDPSAALLWDEAAGRLAQHQAAWDLADAIGRRPQLLGDDAYAPQPSRGGRQR